MVSAARASGTWDAPTFKTTDGTMGLSQDD
jgi:hypothetical protein